MACESGSPYSAQVYRQLATGICRNVRSRCIPPKKVLALDADGTLWSGTVAEDGPEGLSIGRGFQRFQQIVRDLRARGIVLVLVSRNQRPDIEAAFAQNPEMPLSLDDFASHRINWQSKAENLRSIAVELNLSLDSFVFADDNPAERADVEFHCPEVTVLPLTDDSESNATMLSRLWCFDSPVTTADDLSRSDYLRNEKERRRLAVRTTDFTEYLCSLKVVVEMRKASPEDFPRIAQLTQKTNQFNLSLRRRTLAEIEKIAKNHAIHIISAEDRFGVYGTVGVAILSHDTNGRMEVDTFLLSCRALGRGVEQAFLHGICKAALEAGAKSIILPFVEGARNQPLREFLETTEAVSTEALLFKIDPHLPPLLPSHVVFTNNL